MDSYLIVVIGKNDDDNDYYDEHDDKDYDDDYDDNDDDKDYDDDYNDNDNE